MARRVGAAGSSAVALTAGGSAGGTAGRSGTRSLDLRTLTAARANDSTRKAIAENQNCPWWAW
jgi:hypothetical protein